MDLFIGHSMSIWNLILGVHSVTVSNLIHCNSLLQNVIYIITKCDSYSITKCGRSLLQNASSSLLQNVTVLLQNKTVISNSDDFITKCDSYYKMWRLLKIATEHILFWCFHCLLWICKYRLENTSKVKKCSKRSNLISTHFRPIFPFYTPWKKRKTLVFVFYIEYKMGRLAWNGFLVFSGSIKWEYLPEIY